MVIEDTFTAKNGKQYPVLTMKENEESKFPLTMGVAKAKLAIQHIEELKAFVAKHSG